MQDEVYKEPCHGVTIEEEPYKPNMVIIEKPAIEMKKHIRPLYIKAHVNGHPISRVLIDNGSAVNILRLRVLKKLGKEETDLIPTEVSVIAFTGEATKTIGVFPAEVLGGSKTSISAFFVVNSSANFQALLGRDWIHANHCIPSSMHQFLMFWIGDDVEIVQADSQPFQASSSVVESRYYNGYFGPIKFYGKSKSGQPKSVYMETLETNEMFNIILKTTVLMIEFHQVELEAAATSIKKAQVQQTIDLIRDSLEWEVNGSEIIFEEELDSFEELQLEDLAYAPSQLEDHQPQVQDPLKEMNLGDFDNPKHVYISALLTDELKIMMKELLAEFKDCFAWSYEDMPGLDRHLVEHRLPIKDDFKPFKQPLRRMSKEVETKNGKLRVCIDFRDLNRATPKYVYVMPITDMLIDSVANNKLLSFMDGYSWYNQIKIDEIDTSKTAFRCPRAIGTFEWLVMPFGLKNAGATYQREMNAIFHDMINHSIKVYIDDIVVKSRKAEDHVEHLRKSFERMRKHNLKLNPMKCAFGVKAGNFLGFLVHQHSVEVDQNKSNTILEARPPKSKKEVQRFLGQSTVFVVSKTDLVKYMLSRPVLSGRIGKWSLALTEFKLIYCSQKSIKGQTIAEFLAHHLGSDESILEKVEISVYGIEEPPWTLEFDGSSTEGTAGADIVIISPTGVKTALTFNLDFSCTNNQAEYKALVIGLEVLKDLRAKNVQVIGDSQLVLRQVAGEYKCTSDWREELKEALQFPEKPTPYNLRMKVLNYILVEDDLYRK
ncbi:uncharacterized protein [Henckelia pumila]|uniref:uncharacterized protein n=1 Tax=Henckelia pumila TaxID=405737 RepID=UPI003C6E922A